MKKEKTKGDPKTRTIQVRLSEEQYALFKAVADEIGLDLSNWVRMICLAATKKQRESE